PRPGGRLLGGPLHLPLDQDGRAAHGGPGPDLRPGADPREQRGRLGRERSLEGAQDPAGHARGGPSGRHHRDHLLAQPRALLLPERPAGDGRGRRDARRRPAPPVGGPLGAARPGAPRRPLSPPMRRTLVLDVVGLTSRLVGEHTPHLADLARRGALRPLTPVIPAVTCTVQSTFLTGTPPREHGIAANGWYFRDLAEVWFWRQSN